eukprot:821554_1
MGQIFTDLFAYILWFSYAVILANLPRFARDISRRTLIIHIGVAFIASFGIAWFLITMLYGDFVFMIEIPHDHLIVAQIICEGILIIEWMHIIFESWIHQDHHTIQMQTSDVRMLLFPFTSCCKCN